ncbi:hypothetical protein R76706_03265 [Ralstonia mannitolilytica]|nr:hypothetical protein R76706_03265 [Ralstonia mannitolilytica]
MFVGIPGGEKVPELSFWLSQRNRPNTPGSLSAALGLRLVDKVFQLSSKTHVSTPRLIGGNLKSYP